MDLKYRPTMKTTTNWMMHPSAVLLILSLLSVVFLTACQREAPVAPSTPSTTVDDNGSGGNGSDDPPGDDNGGGN
jgi:hypothetical protein